MIIIFTGFLVAAEEAASTLPFKDQLLEIGHLVIGPLGGVFSFCVFIAYQYYCNKACLAREKALNDRIETLETQLYTITQTLTNNLPKGKSNGDT